MAFPAAPTESGAAKIHFLTTDGNSAAGWFGVTEGSTGTGSNTVGFAAVATHVEGDAVAAPGGLNTTATDVPVVLVAGDDGTNAVPLQLSGSDLKITLDSEAVVLGAGTAEIGKLAAGTAAIGKLAANSGVDIGDVTLTTGANTIGEVTIGAATGAAGDLAKAEDAVHGSGDIGVMALAVRNDALAALAGADGDYAPTQVNAEGAVYVRPAVSPTGGCKMFTSVDLDQTEEDPTAGPTTIYGIYAWNLTAAPLWLQMFNTNTVTVGTTAPTNNFLIPANADSDGAGVVLPVPVCGLAYSTALTVAITTGSGTNNGAPGAGDAGIAILYQD
ncbi:hypothetical protein LCGC14_1316400 [marine sediment metagenome]|uniref:Uncharacterized protein n=1 Tax=marine sediment metagenome TaxID=412755 RepID=A0A0F9KKT3_9ZZZZ